MEALWEVSVYPYTGGARNEYGNVIDSWATTPVQKEVYGWSPAGTNESTASRHTVTADVELLVPPGFTLDSRDHVQILGVTYEVQGEVEDYNHGPFGFTPGGRVNLRVFKPNE